MVYKLVRMPRAVIDDGLRYGPDDDLRDLAVREREHLDTKASRRPLWQWGQMSVANEDGSVDRSYQGEPGWLARRGCRYRAVKAVVADSSTESDWRPDLGSDNEVGPRPHLGQIHWHLGRVHWRWTPLQPDRLDVDGTAVVP
jgi:hypothetical protein